MDDHRPENCRFRLRDEGKPYPRSGCRACRQTIVTGLGKSCSIEPDLITALTTERDALAEALAKAVEALEHAKLNMPHPDQMIDDAIAQITGNTP